MQREQNKKANEIQVPLCVGRGHQLIDKQELRVENDHLQEMVAELSNEVLTKENESKQVKKLKEKTEKELNDLKRRQWELQNILQGIVTSYSLLLLLSIKNFNILYRKRFEDRRYEKTYPCT